MKLNLLFVKRSGSCFFKKAAPSLHDSMGMIAGGVEGGLRPAAEGMELLHGEVRRGDQLSPWQLPAQLQDTLPKQARVSVSAESGSTSEKWDVESRQKMTVFAASRPWLLSLPQVDLMRGRGINCSL